MIDRRTVLLGGILCAGGVAALAIHPSISSNRHGSATRIILPSAFGRWISLPADRVVLPPSDALTEASYQQVVVSAYSDGRGPAIIVLVAYGPVQTHSLQLHRPETCYPSSGFQILSLANTKVVLEGRDVPANWMAAQRGNRSDRLLYWTRIGQSFTSDIWDQRLMIARNALQGAPTDGVLVRLSVEAAASPDADARLLEFARTWVSALEDSDQKLLLGGTS